MLAVLLLLLLLAMAVAAKGPVSAEFVAAYRSGVQERQCGAPTRIAATVSPRIEARAAPTSACRLATTVVLTVRALPAHPGHSDDSLPVSCASYAFAVAFL